MLWRRAHLSSSSATQDLKAVGAPPHVMQLSSRTWHICRVCRGEAAVKVAQPPACSSQGKSCSRGRRREKLRLATRTVHRDTPLQPSALLHNLPHLSCLTALCPSDPLELTFGASKLCWLHQRSREQEGQVDEAPIRISNIQTSQAEQ